MSLSPQWKGLQKYVTKAKQIEKIDAAISYYLRMYTIQEAMKLIKQRSADDNKQLSSLMDQVESTKSIVKDLSKDDAKLKLETYALNVFDHADNEDRAGKANREVAQAFLSASILMEACKQFGELATDIEQKLKYARWRTVEITKAMKEGRQPAPPADNGDAMNEDLPAPGSSFASASSSSFPPPSQSFPAASAAGLPSPSSLSSSNSSSSNSAPLPSSFGGPPSVSASAPGFSSYPPSISAPVPSSSLLSPPSTSSFGIAPPPNPSPPPTGGYPSPSAHAAPPLGPLSVGVGMKPVVLPDQPVYRYAPGQPLLVYPVDVTQQKMTKIQTIKEGERFTKHALSALSFDDINTAIAKLQLALSVLAPYQTEKKR